MLINTAEGWQMIQRPIRTVREAPTPRALACVMGDELAELCPSMSLQGAQVASRMMRDLLGRRFGFAG